MTTVVSLNDEAWEDVEEGTEALLDEWHVSEGETVSEGQCLANVMLIKSNHEILAPVAGIVGKLHVQAQENFGKGDPLVEIA